MIFRRLRQITVIFALTLVVQVVAAQDWIVQLQFSPNPSPYLSDWSSRANTVQLLVVNPTTAPRDVKILATIEHNLEVVAYTNPDKLLPQTIPAAGQRTYFGEAIVPMAAMHFEDNIDQSTQRSGRIPDGSICVTVKVVDATTLELIKEDRKCVTIISYTPAYLILPENEAVLCKLGEHNVIEMNSGNPRPMFRWTPVVPAPDQPVRYQLKIFEVLPGQYPTTAFLSARPLFERELVGMTELIWPVEYFYPEVGKRYVWSVRALDYLGRPLVSYQDGWATPFLFSVSDECGEGNIDINGDGIADINRLGDPIEVHQKIEVRISGPQTMPLNPDIGHEFTGRARSASGGPFNYNWYLREVGSSKYLPLKKQPIPSNLWLAPGEAKGNRAYLLKLVAEKGGQVGWHEITITMGPSSEDSGSEAGLRTWDEGASQSETAWSSSPNRSGRYTAANFALELNGENAGFLRSFEGAATQPGIAGDFKMQVGLSMGKGLYEWIEQSWNKNYSRKNGAIIACDFNYKERARREFHDALIQEIQMPALDAGSKDPAYITIKVQTANVLEVKADSNKKLDASVQKKWLPSNFRLKIGDLPCSKVNKIEAITIKQTNMETGRRDALRVPGRVEYPNLTFTIPQTDAQPWIDYFDSYTKVGDCTPEHEKGGTLEYLANDLPMFTLQFNGICPRKLTRLPADADGVRRVKIEMYCEDIRFSYSPSATK